MIFKKVKYNIEHPPFMIRHCPLFALIYTIFVGELIFEVIYYLRVKEISFFGGLSFVLS